MNNGSEGNDPILRQAAVCGYLGVSRPTIYRLIAAGLLPPPAKIGIRAIGWRKSVLDRYIRSREGARDAATA